MVKRLLLSGMMATGAAAAYAQPSSFTSYQAFSDSCAGGTSTLLNNGVVWGLVSNFQSGMTVEVHWGDGQSNSVPLNGNPNATGSFSGQHAYGSPGTYSTMAVLFNAANTPLDTSYVTINAFCNTIWGIAYKKNDGNCTYDLGVDELINFPFEVEVRKNNVPYDTFSTSGNFIYTIPNADLVSEYSLHPLNDAPGYLVSCPSGSNVYKVRLDTMSNMNNGFDFGYTCNSAITFDMYTYLSGFLRFTNNSYLQLNVGNASCLPQNGVVTLEISPKYTFSTATTTPTSVAGQVVTWNLNNLDGTNSPYIVVTMIPATTLTPGDTACNYATISPATGDINTANNSFTFCDSINASYDPNEKHVSPLGDITAGQMLTYTINFENLGNDTAFNIHILDTLSGNLDLSSFELLTSSHPVRTNLVPAGSSEMLRFDFVDIGLADKDHPESNKGFVMYKAMAKNSMVPGDRIMNTAHIYFDINPAVVTNTVTSAIPTVSSIGNITSADDISIYPNPGDKELFVENTAGLYNRISLINVLGQLVHQQAIDKGLNKIAIARLAPGIYSAVVTGEKQTRMMKISKRQM